MAQEGILPSLGREVQHWLTTMKQPNFKASIIRSLKKVQLNGIKTFSQKN